MKRLSQTDANNNKIINLADGSSSGDGVNKGQLDKKVTLDSFKHSGSTPDRRYIAGLMNATSLSSTSYSNGGANFKATPHLCTKTITIDRLAFTVTVVASAGGVARAGIYSNVSQSNVYPDALLLDGGEFSTESLGVKEATVNLTLTEGNLYWFVFLPGVAAVSIRTIPVAAAYPILGTDNAFNAATTIGWAVTRTYGALPSTYPSSATAFTSPITAIAYRVT